MATTTFTVDMRAPLDRLKADMGGATGVVVNAARTMERGVASIGGAIIGSLGGLLTFGNVFATLAGATGIGLLIKRATSLGDELGEMAIRTGLSTTRLQELQFAAATAGVSTEQLDTSMKFLNQRIEAAASGDSAAKQLFASLGVAVTAGNQIRSLADIIDDLADSIRKSVNPTRDVTVATELMGRAGVRNLVWLKEGSEGLKRFADEAHKSGAVLGGEMIDQLGTASDAITKMANAIDKNLARAIVELTPIVTAFATALSSLAASVGPLLQTILSPERVGTNELERRLELLQDRMVRVRAEAGGLGDTLNKFFGHAVDARRAEVVAGLQGEIDKIQELIKTRKSADLGLSVKPPLASIPPLNDAQRQAVEEAKRIVESLNPSLTAADRKVIELANRFDSLAKAAGNAAPRVQELAKQAQELALKGAQTEGFNKIVEVFEKSQPTFDAEGKKLQELQKQFDDAADGAGAFGETIRTLGTILIEDIRAFNATKIEIDRLTRAMEDADAEARDMASLVRALEQPFQDLDDTIDEYIKQLSALKTATDIFAGTGLAGLQTFGQGQAQALESQIQKIAQSRAALNASLADIEPGTQFDKLTAAIVKADAELIRLSGDLRQTVENNRVDALEHDFFVLGAQFKVFGGDFDVLGAKIARTIGEINALLEAGAGAEENRVKALQDQLTSLQNTQRVVEFVSGSVQLGMTRAGDTLIDAFVRGEAAAIKWGDVITDILADILKQLFQIFVIEVAIKAIKGIATSAFGGGGEIGGLDAGGIVTKPGIFAIAETGAEAVIPLDRLRMGGGGGDVTINIHPPTGTESTAQESTDSKGNRSIDIFITKIVQKGMAHGAFDRDLASNFGLTRQGSRR